MQASLLSRAPPAYLFLNKIARTQAQTVGRRKGFLSGLTLDQGRSLKPVEVHPDYGVHYLIHVASVTKQVFIVTIHTPW